MGSNFDGGGVGLYRCSPANRYDVLDICEKRGRGGDHTQVRKVEGQVSSQEEKTMSSQDVLEVKVGPLCPIF